MSDTAPTPPPNERQQLCVWQQNLNKSLVAHSDFLQSLRHEHYHLAMLQEPYVDFQGKSRATLHWHVIYLSLHGRAGETTRAITLVNASLPSNSWSQIPVQSVDIVGIQIHGTFGTLRFMNIYNDCAHNGALEALHRYMRDPVTREYLVAPL
jgi:hypothetical protein